MSCEWSERNSGVFHLNGEILQQNKNVFQAAIENNHKVHFTLNVYNKEGKLVPCREKNMRLIHIM